MSLIASTGPFVQPGRLSDWLKHEYSVDYCRQDATLLAGSGGARSVVSGQLLGKVATGTQSVTVTAKAGNTASIGVIASATADAKMPQGRYEVLIIEPGTDAGKFEVRKPNGKLDGSGTVGVAYNGSVNFTWADGATDVVPGDAFFIDVDYAAGEAFVGLDLTGVDGSQVVAAIAVNDATTPENVAGRVLILDSGPALVELDNLTWPAGITAAQKLDAVDQLRLLGIRPTP